MLRLLLALLVLSGCGSTYIAAPEPFDAWGTCETVERTLTGYAIYTPIPIPFAGPRSFTLYTDAPDGWSEFEGSLRLLGITWDIDWISNGSIQIGDLAVAQLEDGVWTTSPTLDLTDVIYLNDDDRLVFEAKLRGSGVKPSGKQTITVTAEAAVCGEGRELIAEGFRALDSWEVE